MLKRCEMLILVASIWLTMPQLSLAALSPKTQTASQQTVSIKFNVADAFNIQSASLRSLMLELYDCQPQDLQKNTKVSKEEFVEWVFEGPFDWKFDAIKNAQSIEALTLSFSQEYQGDRILPLITGLYTMLLHAYGGENEFTFNNTISLENFTIATQNIEIITTKLQNSLQEKDSLNLHEVCIVTAQKKLIEIKKKLLVDYEKISHVAGSNPLRSRIDESSGEFIKF